MQSFISYLIEKRSNPDKNEKVGGYNQLEKYRDHADGLYASYTAIDKIGINPQSSYNTPNGIYVYHLTFMFKNMQYNKSLTSVPFAGSQPNVWIIKPTVPVLVLQEYSEEQLQSDVQKLIQAFKQKEPNVEETIESAGDRAKNNLFGTKMWNITRTLAKGNANRWNYILRNILGYSVIRDDGGGIIHPAEPHQGVFLSVKALKVVDKIKNDAYRSRSNSDYKKQQIDLFNQRLTVLRQVCDKFLKFEKLEDFKLLIKEIGDASSYNPHGKFSIEKALGTRGWSQLKKAVLSYDNLFYVLQLAHVTEDNDLVAEIASDANASLKFADMRNGRFIDGESAIAKDKNASIKYLNYLNGLMYSSVLLGHHVSNAVKKMASHFLQDENSLQKFYKKWGVGGITELYHNYPNTPALTDLYNKLKGDKPSDDLGSLSEIVQRMNYEPNNEKLANNLNSITNILVNSQQTLTIAQFNKIVDIIDERVVDSNAMELLVPFARFYSAEKNHRMSENFTVQYAFNIIRSIKDGNNPRRMRTLLKSILMDALEPTKVIIKIIKAFNTSDGELSQYYGVLKTEIFDIIGDSLTKVDQEKIEDELNWL